MSFSLGLHIKVLSVLYRQQYGGFPSFKRFPVPATHPDGKVLQTKAVQWRYVWICFQTLQIASVLLFALGKPANEGHNYRFIRDAENPFLPLSFPLFFLQSKLSANTSQHLIAVTQVITRNKKDLVFLNVFCLSLYPGCCFHLNLFFTTVIWSPQPITKRADYVKPKCHGAVKAQYPECKAQAGSGASALEFHKGFCWLPDQKGHTRQGALASLNFEPLRYLNLMFCGVIL